MTTVFATLPLITNPPIIGLLVPITRPRVERFTRRPDAGAGALPQLPVTLPPPSKRKSTFAAHPAVIATALPSVIGATGAPFTYIGGWNEGSSGYVSEYGPTLEPASKSLAMGSARSR